MNYQNKKAILFIDGDNIAANMADAITECAKKYGTVSETHLFANFKSADTEWSVAAYKYAMHIHHLPVMVAKKNTTDIGLTIAVMRELYSSSPADVFIIASNDSDFMPVAMEIRSRGKTAVCLYTSKDNTQQLSAYNDFHLVEKQKQAGVDEHLKTALSVKEILDGYLKNKDKLKLNTFNTLLKKKLPGYDVKKDYKKPCSGVKSFLRTVFLDYPDKFDRYEIKIDCIEKKAALALRDNK